MTSIEIPSRAKKEQSGFYNNVNDNPVPFDGCVILLVAASIGYCLKKANDRKKANKAEENKM